jgi:hypothetical protein
MPKMRRMSIFPPMLKTVTRETNLIGTNLIGEAGCPLGTSWVRVMSGML